MSKGSQRRARRMIPSGVSSPLASIMRSIPGPTARRTAPTRATARSSNSRSMARWLTCRVVASGSWLVGVARGYILIAV